MKEFQKASWQCRHFFIKSELVNYFVRRLHEASREGVSQHLYLLPEAQSEELSIVRQVSKSNGNSHWVLIQQQSSSNSTVPPAKCKASRLTILLPQSYPSQAPAPYAPQPPQRDANTLGSFYDVAVEVDSILFLKEDESLEGETSSPFFQEMLGDDTSRPVLSNTQEVLQLTEE